MSWSTDTRNEMGSPLEDRWVIPGLYFLIKIFLKPVLAELSSQSSSRTCALYFKDRRKFGNFWKESAKRLGARLFSVVPSSRMGNCKLSIVSSLWTSGSTFVLQRWQSTSSDCSVSLWNLLTEDFQKLPRCGPWHPPLDIPAWAKVPSSLSHSMIHPGRFFFFFPMGRVFWELWGCGGEKLSWVDGCSLCGALKITNSPKGEKIQIEKKALLLRNGSSRNKILLG